MKFETTISSWDDLQQEAVETVVVIEDVKEVTTNEGGFLVVHKENGDQHAVKLHMISKYTLTH